MTSSQTWISASSAMSSLECFWWRGPAPSRSGNSAASSNASKPRPHPRDHAIAANELVPECTQSVQTCHGEQRVGEIAVNVFSRMKDRAVGFDAEIDLKESKIKNASVPDKSHYADHGN